MAEEETISLEEYNKYAEAEERAIMQKAAESAPRSIQYHELEDHLQAVREDHWAEQICTPEERDYDAEGNPV